MLLHGLFGAARNLGVLSRAFSGTFHVLAMDLRNHGDSPHGAMDYESMAADVAETLAREGIGQIRLCGHSMGGKTAMMLALSRPDLVERLAVMDVAPVAYDHDYAGIVEAMRNLPLSAGLTRGEADQALAATVKEAPMRAFLLNNLVLGAVPRWRVGLEEIAASMPAILSWEDPPGGRPYEGRALFLCGAASDYVPPAVEPAIMRRFPNAEIQRVAGAAHWLHADKPEQVITALQEFFTS